MSAIAAGERTHQHVVGLYDRDDDLVVGIAEFLADALANDGTAIVIATPAHCAAVDAALTRAGVSVASLAGSGSYVVLDAADTMASFMRHGRPDADLFDATIGAIVARAAARGGPLALFGEMVALLWDEGNLEGALELEARWNHLADHYAFALFCAYAMSSLETSGDLSAARRMCDRHSSVIPLSGDHDSLAEGARSDHYDRMFIATPKALRDVRRFVRDALAPWVEDEVLEDAEIIASELATNALKHAESPFRVSLSRLPDVIRIAVRDTSFKYPVEYPEWRRPDGGHVGGRGLQLVAALSRAWGADAEPDGKTVWAEVRRSGAASE